MLETSPPCLEAGKPALTIEALFSVPVPSELDLVIDWLMGMKIAPLGRYMQSEIEL